MSRKIKPASLACSKEKRKAHMASPTVAHFLPLLNFVSCNTVRNVPINEKALPIPRNRSIMKNRWIQCPPCGIVPNATGQLPSTRLNDEYHRIARIMILRSHYLFCNAQILPSGVIPPVQAHYRVLPKKPNDQGSQKLLITQ